MNKENFATMTKAEKAYSLLLSKMFYYHEELKKVTLFKQSTSRGPEATVVCYLHSANENTFTDTFRFYGKDADEYIWFLNYISKDFPEAEFQDLTDEKKPLTATFDEGGEDV